MVKKIELTKGAVALVDDNDFPIVSKYRWYAQENGSGVYAARRSTVAGQRSVTYLHRFLVGEDAARISFDDGDSLNCQRANLVIQSMKPGFPIPQEPAPESRNAALALVLLDLARQGHETFTPALGAASVDIVSISPGTPAIRWKVQHGKSRSGTVHFTAPKGASVDGFAIVSPGRADVLYVSSASVRPGANAIRASEPAYRTAAFALQGWT